MCMYRFPWSPQGTGAVGGCELLCVGARNGTGPLQEQCTLLTHSSAAPSEAFLKIVSQFLNNIM